MDLKNIKTEKELFDLWKTRKNEELEIDHSKKFIEDGIVDEKLWENGSKILYFLKEAYTDENSDKCFSLTDAHRRFDWLEYKTSIWYRVAEWTYGLNVLSSMPTDKIVDGEFNIVPRYKYFKDGELDKNLNSEIAFVNIKKSNGKSNSNFKELKKYCEFDREFIKRQIEIINPKIIVCGGTEEFFYKIFNQEDIFLKDKIVIKHCHPSIRADKENIYYGLVNKYVDTLRAKLETK